MKGRGAWGEAVAREYLQRRGYRLAAANFRTRFGEIDIIAEQGKYIVFVEVKNRRNNAFALAQEAVTEKKQQKIIAAAEEWLQQNPSSLQPRFDVIEVYGTEGAPVPPEINHLEDAFGG